MKSKFRQLPTRMLLVCASAAAFPVSELTAETCISPYIKEAPSPFSPDGCASFAEVSPPISAMSREAMYSQAPSAAQSSSLRNL